LLDATRLRKRGIDTVAIVWDEFEKAARAMAALQGVPNLSIFVIAPLAPGEDDDDQRRKGASCVPDLVACWERLPGAGTVGAAHVVGGGR
jgi:hypothetical protein